MKITTKTIAIILSILIVGILTMGFFAFRSIKKDLNIEIEQRKRLVKGLKIQKRQIIDSLQKKSLNELKTMQNDIKRISTYSRQLIKTLQDYEKRPNYTIDYVDAVDIIARSNYNGKRSDTTKSKKNY